jgi:hypothetical protein
MMSGALVTGWMDRSCWYNGCWYNGWYNGAIDLMGGER